MHMNQKDDNIGFLLVDVSRLMRREFQKRLEGNALTFVQARVLVHLSRQQGMRQVELADILEMQPISLVKLIDQLEDMGLIERRADPVDRRAYQLFLTHAATPYLQDITAMTTAIRQDVLGNLSDKEISAAQKVLVKMRDNLTDQ